MTVFATFLIVTALLAVFLLDTKRKNTTVWVVYKHGKKIGGIFKDKQEAVKFIQVTYGLTSHVIYKTFVFRKIERSSICM